MKWVNKGGSSPSHIACGFNPFHATGPFLYHPENIGKLEDCHCCTFQPSYKYEQCKLNFTCVCSAIFLLLQISGKEEFKPLPSLVVCPPTLTGHWCYEIEKFCSKDHVNPLHYTGSPGERSRFV